MSCKICQSVCVSESGLCPECLLEAIDNPELLDPYSNTDFKENGVQENNSNENP